MEEKLTFTKKELSLAFLKWNNDILKDKSEFFLEAVTKENVAKVSKEQSKTLIEYLK